MRGKYNEIIIINVKPCPLKYIRALQEEQQLKYTLLRVTTAPCGHYTNIFFFRGMGRMDRQNQYITQVQLILVFSFFIFIFLFLFPPNSSGYFTTILIPPTVLRNTFQSINKVLLGVVQGCRDYFFMLFELRIESKFQKKKKKLFEMTTYHYQQCHQVANGVELDS